MNRCPTCRRSFRSAELYAAYLRYNETRAALQAEIAGEDYDVPLRFQTLPTPSVTYSGALPPTKQELHAARSHHWRTHGELPG